MSATAKIIYILLAIFAVGLGIEGYFYYQSIRKPQPVSFPSSSDNPQTPKLIDFTGQVALIGNLNLFDITKEQASEWAKTGGTTEVPTYSGQIPTIPPELLNGSQQSKFTENRPDLTKVLAGYFRGIQGGSIIISQGGKEILVSPIQESRLWIKDGQKLQIVSVGLDKLLYSGDLLKFIRTNDLVLIPGIEDFSERLESSYLVVFK